MEFAANQPLRVVEHFLAAQNAGDIASCLDLLADDALFDVGRGVYGGKEQIASFLDTLHHRGSDTRVLEAHVEGGIVTSTWDQADDDGRQLGIERVQLQAEVTVHDGKITRLYARPTPESLAVLRAAAQDRSDLTPEAQRALGQPE